MKSNYKKKILVTVEDVKREVELECNSKIDSVYDEVKFDVASQVMAVCLLELNKEFGFGKDRLRKFKEGVDSLFIAMSNDGLMGRKFDAITCAEFIKDKYDLDIRARDA